ncbi:hypothetical protein GLOIN_2v1529602 [Rhizophagus irregularis DAOM 181602=DAOM 197198]|uniref:Uncharacterized protein n=2 Tax=Rhizophagus irregularis TaxID=588596 RepID=A0A015NFG3_RHIIW|nr:hypothetical protein GLOIN_2v1529602 [Rhizophagus irregularis DAOM 181602=DAOM 197198]EXX78083.1 hypothetical protein RirG_018130 [Rhizophagus irregularis DAOM 197198w]POG79305.1 hypothetical protein GLOIN_2v1529602 [Rhizophagus irregularis DAOM 181602=DAOM 197198]|eukprot:XP_025186171.1 hypothetical protein GLOIN_2v1529602 [Rhizophagus irregularis DAOM 181602=DAOM 197198]
MPSIPAPPLARYQYLISRRGDFVLSVFAGSLSYYFYERDNPRENGKTLWCLFKRRIKV